jgi:signal transduction histidine kinase
VTAGRFSMRRLGVRSRTTLVATTVVFLVLTISGVLLIVATRSTLYRAVETTATARAVDVAAQLETGTVLTQVPLIRGISVQIVSNGAVVASTADIEGQGPFVEISAPSGGTSQIIQISALDAADNQGETGTDDGDEGPFLVAIIGANVQGRATTVLAAAPLNSVDNATRTLIPLVALGVPAITLLVALVVWRLTGRAFSPVDAMTRQAETISYSDLHRRIPEPDPDDEIRRLAVVLNRMLDRLDTSAARQRQFTADASHELKSPIATLLTMAEVAEAGSTGLTTEELGADVAGQTRRLATLVDDLLTLAQSDERGLRLHNEWFDVADLVAEQITIAATTHVEVDTTQLEPFLIHGDRRRIGQVVRNLLDNAIHHTTSDVRIETHRVGDQATLCISDDGPGIPADDRERIFDRFIRLDEARSRQSGGTGLGLSVVRSIVAAHDGTVTVEDDPRLGGALVTVTLPVPDVHEGDTPKETLS